MTCSAIDDAASCEIHAVIRFLHAKSMSTAEIHHELSKVLYGQNVMNDGTLQCRMFKDGWANKSSR
jgi:hypothetical protein